MSSGNISPLTNTSQALDQSLPLQISPKTEPKQKKEQNSLIPFKCLPKLISPIYRFLSPFTTHRLDSDYLLYDKVQYNELGEVKGLLSNYNSCKRICAASFDSINREVLAQIQPYEDFPITPFDLIIQRLQSQGDTEAYKLSQRVKGLAEYIEKNRAVVSDFAGIKYIKTHPFYKDYQKKIKDSFDKHINEPILSFLFKFSKKTNNLEATEIGFNEAFLTKIGFDSYEDCCKSLLKQGFPDVIFIDENYHNWCSRMISNSFILLLDPRTRKEPMNICLKGPNEAKIQYEMSVEMHKVEIDGYLEIKMLLIMKPKSIGCKTRHKEFFQKQKEPTTTVGENKEKNEKKKCSKGKSYVKEIVNEDFKDNNFIKEFYPECLVKKVKIEPKVCNFRML